MKKLKNVHRVVARELALGIPLDRICETRALNYNTWMLISREELFKSEIDRLHAEIEKQMIYDHCNDPVLVKLKSECLASAKRIVEERDCFDSEIGASSSTRLKAASSILDMNGYGKKEEQGNTAVIINLSPEKLAGIAKSQEGQKTAYDVNFTEESLKKVG